MNETVPVPKTKQREDAYKESRKLATFISDILEEKH